MRYLDYEITKRLMRSRYPYFSNEDFEDRYQDTWEVFLKYPPPAEVNELTAFIRMWDSWYNHNVKRTREHNMFSLLADEYDEEKQHHDTVLSDQYVIYKLFSKVRHLINDKCAACWLLDYQGYEYKEIREQIGISLQSISLYLEHVTILMSREAGYSTKPSRYEVHNSGRNNRRIKQAARLAS